tara:strand:- start:8156 stop:8587 length:432 start_codon:yes stop_codon:yes gene_type:complete
MRIKINIPTPQCFKTEYKIGVADLNYGNHLGNDKVLSIAHQARVDWLSSINQSELKFYNVGLIMVDSACQYKNQGHLNDRITIELSLEQTTKTGFNIYYLMKNQDDKKVAIVKTGMCFFDYENQKITTLSDNAILKLFGEANE